ncbi:NAD(P)H-quinone oxidoreductase [Tunicatimonas pelagia]|uniref:NAD(P)H-quinone oxidoreductase n=1 Tax=Tunicatimonas pelagia TaxID=931531 RepID=UPI002665B015|nr:NAD(P)H-quinone oxidoreductase [Tunicatimonas pelagia]WKN45102.1 NAD(P)H-quinone oxidoreductase [Tunicatimonas pelagia]
MKAILIKSPGKADQLYLGEYETPKPASDEVLVKVHATALNRADILQREGKYPPPEGASPILGLEMSGEVVEVGAQVDKWKIGDKVFGLLSGGGYAEYAVIHQDMAMAIPDNLSFEEAAAIPEVFMTAFQAVHWLGKLQTNERILIHAGASGVGTAAIQLAREMQAGDIIVTASQAKHATCQDLGAHYTIDYKNQDFKKEVKGITDGEGVDVIIDFVAAPYFERNISVLRTDGRLIMLALLGGTHLEQFNLGNLLRKRIQILASTLRSRSRDYQIRLTKAFAEFAILRFQDSRLRPVIDQIMDWQEVKAAHQRMESNQNIGKIVLRIGKS